VGTTDTSGRATGQATGCEDRPRFRDFDTALQDSRLFPLTATGIETLQVNFGTLCNQSCGHCHVSAGPSRSERIGKGTLKKCLEILRDANIATVDITGGAPELNPHFRFFVDACRALDKHVMSRCNLTVLFEPGNEDLAEFYADRDVEVIASMPCYLEKNVDAQRGPGVHEKSLTALKRLNDVGYGREDDGLVLNLVYNPGDDALPPPQCELEADYKRALWDAHGVTFNNLFTIANMPIGRFHEYLRREKLYQSYMERLIDAYNPDAVPGVMCHYTLSVGWDGSLYDCDFNQMLGMRCDHGAPEHISRFDLEKLRSRRVVTGLHCFGCTAGAGSSCGGAVLEQ